MLLALRALVTRDGIVFTNKILFASVNPGAVMNFTAGLFAALSSVVSNIVLIIFAVTFILLEASSFPPKLRFVLDDPQRAFRRVIKFIGDIRRYMVIKTITSLIAGVTIGLWLFILGVDFPVLWGFLAFLLHYVPNLGATMAAIPAILVALLQLGLGPAALVAAGFLVVGFTLGNVVEPRLMCRKFGLSTLVVFLSLVFGEACSE